MKKITVIDYGVGNLFSVRRAFESQGAEVTLTSKADEILSAERLVLPGVGAFADGMDGLRSRGLIEAIRKYSNSGKPFIGMCLGMQMMLDVGEEFGTHEGLGLIPGRVIEIPRTQTSGARRKIPHIGWNGLRLPSDSTTWKHSPFDGLEPGSAVYFLHSFMAVPSKPENRLAVVEYDGQEIVAAVRQGNTFGCQFHPERSGPIGLRIIRSFLEA